MAASFVSILAELRREGFRPKRDIILALTADEERGDVPSNGVYWLANNRRELIDAELGINEGGGGELRGGKPLINRIQVAEKVYTSYSFLVRDPGGHSSVPRRRTRSTRSPRRSPASARTASRSGSRK
jgi:acetylornithine deacetylase/succinyl-diaminopimelate desuccinylase-like protein